MSDSFCGFLDDSEFVDATLDGDDLFAIFESLDSVTQFPTVTPLHEVAVFCSKEGEEAVSASLDCTEIETEVSPKSKRAKSSTVAVSSLEEDGTPDGQQRMSHITVERNRRKQMNKHLSVLRSLMPCFYVKRGDQASIIGGVVDYIKELQQVLQSLEAKKQRKVYSEILSPRLVVSSPRVPSPLSPRKPPLSPRLISPRTPQPTSPYMPRLQQQGYLSPTINNVANNSLEPSPTSSSSSSIINDNINELVANSKSQIAEVEVKFSGANVLLKTVSSRIPGQVVKIIAALEELSLEILNVSINTVDDTMFNAFTIKIGIECQLSAEELAQQIQQTFC